MAKEGIESFLLDCHTNDNIAEIEAVYGVVGFAVIVRLWQKIYSEKGYYCEWTQRSSVLFLSQWFGGGSGVSNNLINEIAAYAIKIGLFDRNLFDRYAILTSERIQKQYFEVVKRRKTINVISEYLLLSDVENQANVNIISISANKNLKNVCKNSTSKVKVSKGKLSKEERGVTPAPPPQASAENEKLKLIKKTWNGLADKGVGRISKIDTESRRRKLLTALLKEYGLEGVLKNINKIRESDFLCGDNERGWIISFDWFIKPGNFLKVYEDTYKNNRRERRNTNNFNNFNNRQYSEEEISEFVFEEQIGGLK